MRVIAVGMCRPEDAAAFCGGRAPSVTCVCDRSMRAYAAYGLSRGSFMDVMGPAAGVAAVRAATHGHISGNPMGGDVWMMPGTFAIDAGGVVRAAHYARHSGDQPDLDGMIAAVAQPRLV